MESKKMINEELLDAAACEAIGSHTHEESAAYQHELAGAGAAGRSVDRQMRQTVAALAAASPHMKASDDLRARILQATAPKSFRLEDYRKASREDGRYYKWGFYAAAMFLVMGAMYNISVKGNLDQANANYHQLQQQAQAIAKDDVARTLALNAFANPESQQFVCLDENKQPFGRGIVNLKNQTAVIILPQEIVAAGVQPQLALDVGGKKVVFATSLITASAKDIGVTLPDGAKLPNNFALKNVIPEANNTRTAGLNTH